MISIIICTYKRAFSLKNFLDSIKIQSLLPDELLIIDGSPDTETKEMLEKENFSIPNLKYFQVPPEHRGLTRQRNYGIKQLSNQTDIVCFFDDDVILNYNYIELLDQTFRNNPDCVGLSGYIKNDQKWEVYDPKIHSRKKWYIMDNYALKLGERNYARKLLGLFPDTPPGYIPPYGHGYSQIPFTGKTYEVEHIIGCNMSFRKFVFDKIHFSNYFEGYGLYEDLDFSYRASLLGKILINTNLLLEHHHHPSGRPDTYKFGKMVTRNGWYVWRLKYRHPSTINRLKWNATCLLLSLILLKKANKSSARMEFLGRISGFISIIFNPPKIEY